MYIKYLLGTLSEDACTSVRIYFLLALFFLFSPRFFFPLSPKSRNFLLKSQVGHSGRDSLSLLWKNSCFAFLAQVAYLIPAVWTELSGPKLPASGCSQPPLQYLPSRVLLLFIVVFVIWLKIHHPQPLSQPLVFYPELCLPAWYSLPHEKMASMYRIQQSRGTKNKRRPVKVAMIRKSRKPLKFHHSFSSWYDHILNYI